MLVQQHSAARRGLGFRVLTSPYAQQCGLHVGVRTVEMVHACGIDDFRDGVNHTRTAVCCSRIC